MIISPHMKSCYCVWTHSSRWVCGRLPRSRWTESGDGSQSRRGSRAAAVWLLLWLDENLNLLQKDMLANHTRGRFITWTELQRPLKVLFLHLAGSDLKAPDSTDKNGHFTSQNVGVTPQSVILFVFLCDLLSQWLSRMNPKVTSWVTQQHKQNNWLRRHSHVLWGKINIFVNEVWWLWTES